MESGQDAGAVAAPARAGEDEAPGAAAAGPVAAESVAAEPVAAESVAAESGAAGPAGAGAVAAGESPAPGRPARLWTAAMAVLLALLIAGLAAGGIFLARVRGYDDAASRRQAVVAAVRHAVADLTTADYRYPQRYTARLRAESTGRFLSLFSNSATGFAAVLTRGRVQTTGQVAAVGVRHLDANTAQLTVLAYVTVRNSQTPNGTQRIYRLAVSMVSAGPRWLLSNVEFVR